MDRKERYFNIRSKDVENAKGRIEMTENKVMMDKKSPYFNQKGKNREKIKEKRIQSKKNKQMRKKRLIIRNLSFKVSEDELKEIFSKFGEILDVIIPIKEDGKKRGFAFVQYKDTKSQIKAMKEMNFKEIHGRPIAIDFAVDKTTYQTSQKNTKPSDSLEKSKLDETASNNSDESEDEDIKSENGSKTNCEDDTNSDKSKDQEDSKVKAFFEEFDANKQENSDSESIDESSDDAEEEDDDDDDDQNFKEDEESDSDTSKKLKKKKHSEDISEGKTIFIRNISYNSTEEDLQELVQNFGNIQYCLFCMDHFTGQFKGSAFVKFKEKECADKLIQESSKEPGIILHNRPLNCTYALSREDLSKQSLPSKTKDKRNLNLLKCGLIAHGSKEAEGVSKTDMAKRAQLENAKKQKLRNVNFFVSDKRLMVHNLPKNINDKDLWVMFKKAAGKEATIKEARVMKDFKKTDARGIPVSRGFGFVSFTQHDHALKALMELNNNPRIFTPYARPIVEFSVENKVALLSQEKKRERLKMRNKKKIVEGISQSEEPKSPIKIKGKKMKNSQQHFSKDAKAKNNHFQKMKQRKSESPSGVTKQKSSKKKQKKLSRSRAVKEAVINAEEKNNLSVLANKYKEKLLNKYS